jgi:hypothetical protein
MKWTVFILLLALASAFSSGCAITTTQAINRFDLPETRGTPGSGYAEFGLQEGLQTTITPDYTAVPLQINPTLGRYAAEARLAGGIDILDSLEIEAKLQADSPTVALLKYQILGPHQLEAKEGDYSLAVTAGGGGGSNSGSGNSVPFPPSVNSSYSYTTSAADFAVIGGYRTSDFALLYGGPFYEINHYGGSVTQSPTSGQTVTNFAGHTATWGGNVGMAFFLRRALFKIELATAHSSNGNSGTTGVYPGATVGFVW